MPALGITHLCPETVVAGSPQSEVRDFVLQGRCDLLEAEGQLHLLGGRVLLQGPDDLRAACVRTQTGERAAQALLPRGGPSYLVVVLLGILVELVQGH